MTTAPTTGRAIDRSAIEWTGPTWNPWQGCRKVSAGCRHCYMFRDMKRYGKDPKTVRRSADATFNKPLKWQREVDEDRRNGRDRLVFTCSWSDFFLEEADAWRADAWDIIRRCPGLVMQILTKRIERVVACLPSFADELQDRVWIGVTIESQEVAPRRLRHLAALRDMGFSTFVSYEPALSMVDWWNCGVTRALPVACPECGDEHVDGDYDPDVGRWWRCQDCGYQWSTRGRPIMDWLICGGESGGKEARIMHPQWARHARDFCNAHGVGFFFKQWGEWRPPVDGEHYSTAMGQAAGPQAFIQSIDGTVHCCEKDCIDHGEAMIRVGKKKAGRLLDGAEHNAMPALPAYTPKGTN